MPDVVAIQVSLCWAVLLRSCLRRFSKRVFFVLRVSAVVYLGHVNYNQAPVQQSTSDFRIHPNYNSNTLNNDIAIIGLNTLVSETGHYTIHIIDLLSPQHSVFFRFFYHFDDQNHGINRTTKLIHSKASYSSNWLKILCYVQSIPWGGTLPTKRSFIIQPNNNNQYFHSDST